MRSASISLGIRPEYDGLRIDLCIPSQWEKFEVQRIFRVKPLEIKVDNSTAVQKGIEELQLSSGIISGNLLPVDMLKAKNIVEVKLGE
jgi:N,N'-diacetylchitobiose phosphorylase